MVLTQLEEIEHVNVPGLEIHGEGSLALAATLVDETGCVIEHLQHGHESVCVTIRAAYVAINSAHVRDCQANASRGLGNLSYLLQCFKDSVYRIFFHGKKEAGAHLGSTGASVEQGGCGMREKQSTHVVVGFEGRLEVLLVYANADPHEHVLRALYNLFSVFHQIGALQGLKAEIVVIVVSLEVQLGLDQLRVVANHLVHIVRQHWGWSANLIFNACVEAGGNF